MKKLTIKDIAKEFNVSISTVSKALNDSYEISAATKDKIQKYAKAKNYKPNFNALSLKNRSTKTIGIIIPTMLKYFFAQVFKGIEKTALERGYKVIACISNESYNKEVEIIEMLSNGSIDGFILLDRLEWDAFHEGEDLILHAEKFKALFGCWPKSIHADKAYTTRKNRKWCQEREINLHGAKLGRPKKETTENKEAIKLEKEMAKKSESERVEIEGKFGVAKRRYGAGKIMAKLKSTSESLIMLAILNVNLGKMLANLSLSQIYILLNLFKNQNPKCFHKKLLV